jgi:RimJ/RimL family protein N-acetyltransferase
LTSFYNPIIHKNPGFVLFLLIDKTRTPSTSGGITGEEGAIAGHMAYMNTSEKNLATEIGYVLILPPFQRTHVTSNATGLMMHYMLDTPERGGLGLRRVFWQTNALNLASRRTAERLGFRFEGILRWDRVLPNNKQEFGNGIKVREGDPRGEACVGRDTAMFSHCWDDWEGGGREKVDAIMARMS